MKKKRYYSLKKLLKQKDVLHPRYSLDRLKKIILVSSDSHFVRIRSVFTTFLFKWRRYFSSLQVELRNSATTEEMVGKSWLDQEWTSEKNGRVFFICSEG